MPEVSIITPLYNKGTYVTETIRSVLAQAMTDWEMVIVENGSTDNGPELVRKFTDPRIKLVDSPRRGPGAARNFGLGQAVGEWILFLDADDLLAPDFLSSRLDLARVNPAADLLAGSWEEFADGQSAHVLRHPAAQGQPVEILEQSAIAFAPWAVHAALVRRSRLTSDLLWKENLDGLPSEDTAFWFPVIHGATIAWTDRAGAIYRLQTTGGRNEIHDVERWIRAVIAVVESNVEFLQRKGVALDPRQCAGIVRVMESSYRLGVAKHSRAAANLALAEANRWLGKYPASTPSMAARKFFGLRLFNLIRYGVI